MSEPKFQTTYTLTAWDYAAMARGLTRRPWTRSMITMVLWLFAVWCLLVFSTNECNPVTMAGAIVASGATLWMLGCLVVVLLISLGTHWLSWAISFLYYRQIASANATITIALHDDAIRVKSSVANSSVPWATVKRIIVERDCLMLAISKREAFILPRRGFESQEQFDNVYDYARRRRSAALAE